MLPRIKILFENGALGLVVPSPDGVLGYMMSGTAVAGKFNLNQQYILRSYDGLADLGIDTTNNPAICKAMEEFYAEAGAGTEVWIMGFPNTVKVSDLVDVNQNYGKLLLLAANGRLRGLIAQRTPAPGYTPTIANGMDSDVAAAMLKAQALGEWATTSKFAPIFTLLEGYAYSGVPADLTDLTTGAYNRVGVFIGDTVASSKGTCIGHLAGRIAASPVHYNVGRVKSGPLKLLNAYIADKSVDVADVESIHDKGYITMRSFVGRSGYFFNDDFMATKPTDDYSHLTHRRTIDKAYRLAYDVLLDVLLDAVPVNADGTLQGPSAKSWQAMVEARIATEMTANGELSGDLNNPNDKGVYCFIDPNQNVVSTSKFNVRLRVRPFGYPRYIDVYLGFQAVAVAA